MGEVVDGEYQKYTVSSGSYIRKHFADGDDRILDLISHLTDGQLQRLRRGGHDTVKVHAAYHAATKHRGSPTVILAKTIKGYGLGESGEGKNITHQQKKLNEDELREFRSRFGVPIDDEDVVYAPFYKPPEDSAEMQYIRECREHLGGALPQRTTSFTSIEMPDDKVFEEFKEGSGDRAVATTMVYVHVLSNLLSDKNVGKLIVPIIPDEARTFGMEALFRQVGIYSHVGQLYEPVDRENLLYYKEAEDGQILEEGITEAGSMSSFLAAGTAYSTLGINTIPFFTYYSMFGFQRIGDLIWAAGDIMAKGFLVGATAGRTTLAGEGLQHQDGHTHLHAYAIPNLKAYDPAFAFEIAAIIKDGIRRMYVDNEDCFYYMTVENDKYRMPPMPKGVKEADILKGLYRFKPAESDSGVRAHLWGSGAIVNEALKAQEILADYGVAADVWSATSYKELHHDGHECDRHNMLNPGRKRRVPYVTQCFENEEGVIVAASDYLRSLPDSLAKWLPLPLVSLGTDGFGLSEDRHDLRNHFEVDARFIALGALAELANQGHIEQKTVKQAIKDLNIDTGKPAALTYRGPESLTIKEDE